MYGYLLTNSPKTLHYFSKEQHAEDLYTADDLKDNNLEPILVSSTDIEWFDETDIEYMHNRP